MRALLNLLFPPKCPFCRKAVSTKRGVCAVCEERYPVERIVRRLHPSDRDEVECVSVYSYSAVAEAIRRFKFGGGSGAASGFAKRMADLVAEEKRPRGCVVTFVPMRKEQEGSRGYNQAELLAKELAAEWKMPCVRLLRKVKKTRTQHKLSGEERRENVKGAFVARKKSRGKTVFLCDDIVTTGATLEECANALFAAGAEKIVAVTVASARETVVKRENL